MYWLELSESDLEKTHVQSLTNLGLSFLKVFKLHRIEVVFVLFMATLHVYRNTGHIIAI